MRCGMGAEFCKAAQEVMEEYDSDEGRTARQNAKKWVKFGSVAEFPDIEFELASLQFPNPPGNFKLAEHQASSPMVDPAEEFRLPGGRLGWTGFISRRGRR